MTEAWPGSVGSAVRGRVLSEGPAGRAPSRDEMPSLCACSDPGRRALRVLTSARHHPSGGKRCPVISPKAPHLQHLFTCLLAARISYLENHLFRPSAYFYGVVCLVLNCNRSFYILDTSPYQVYDCKEFLLFCGFSFHDIFHDVAVGICLKVFRYLYCG